MLNATAPCKYEGLPRAFREPQVNRKRKEWMNAYDTLMKPLEKSVLAKIRRNLIPMASGNVLELGYGTGVNFQYYDPSSVTSLSAIDIRSKPIARAKATFPVRFIEGRAEELPFPDKNFDTVVETLVFCSVPDLHESISEMLRVLRPGGIFIFIDHVKPPGKILSLLFGTVNIFWPHISGGCHLTREPDKLLEAAGLKIIRSGTSGHDIFHWGIGQKI